MNHNLTNQSGEDNVVTLPLETKCATRNAVQELNAPLTDLDNQTPTEILQSVR